MHVKMRTCHNFQCVRKLPVRGDKQPSEIRVEVGFFFMVQNVKNLRIAQQSQAKIGNNNKSNISKQTMS